MQNYKKAIINLDGNSSKIQNKQAVERNIAEALHALNIPYEFYKSKRKGFKVLMEDMNQPDVLYIINDSLQFHFCEKPHILISRSIPWVQSSPKPSTIGRLTQEMIASGPTELIATRGLQPTYYSTIMQKQPQIHLAEMEGLQCHG